jgi:hypothetical protein
MSSSRRRPPRKTRPLKNLGPKRAAAQVRGGRLKTKEPTNMTLPNLKPTYGA